MFVRPWDLPKGLVESRNSRLRHLNCCTQFCSSMKEFVWYRSNISVRGVLFWAVLTTKSVDDSKPYPPKDSDSMMLILPVIAGIYQGHTDLSIWEKRVWSGVVSSLVTCVCCWEVAWIMCHSWTRRKDSWCNLRHLIQGKALRPMAIKGKPRPHWRQFPILIPNFSLALVCHSCLIPRAESRKGLGLMSRKCHPFRHDQSSPALGVARVLVYVQVVCPRSCLLSTFLLP